MIALDIETTGVTPVFNGMVSIGAVHIESGEEFYRENKIGQNDMVSSKALEINGFTSDQIRDPSKITALENLLYLFEWIDTNVPSEERMLIGWNLPSFDVQFLKHYYETSQYKMPKWKFGHRYVDLHSCLYIVTGKSYKSNEVCSFLNIEDEPPIHNALEGAHKNVRIFNAIWDRLHDHGVNGTGSSIITYTGKRLDFNDPQPDQICIEDIAHGLGGTFRFSGQSHELLTVAQHSTNVAGILRKDGLHRNKIAQGLLHDSPEAYLTDIPSPAKLILPDFQLLEKKIAAVISEKMNVDIVNLSSEVKVADKICLYYEANRLFPDEFVQWTKTPNTHSYLEELEEDGNFNIEPPINAEMEFLSQWRKISSL